VGAVWTFCAGAVIGRMIGVIGALAPEPPSTNCGTCPITHLSDPHRITTELLQCTIHRRSAAKIGNMPDT
jgi:hypothetical protein